MEGLFNSSKLLKQSPEYRAIRDAITDNKSQIGMCSFSEVHDHELMWAHYADQFRGICISYSFPSLLKYLGGSVNFVRIYYNETAPTVHRYEKDPARLAKKILSYKNYRWLYEREWRMFAPLGKARYQTIDCVTSVYLGSRISDLNRERITRNLEKLNIEIREMRISKFSISFETA